MNPRFYGCGYRGKTPEKLIKLMDKLDADVMDVRFQPFGRSDFGQVNLKVRLGARYHWNKSWGNEDYKSAHVSIVDFEGGLEKALRVGKDLILLCVCNKPEECHRAVLLSELAKRGYQVRDFDAPPPLAPKREVAQESLFSLD